MTQYNKDLLDGFKTYEGYEGLVIVDDYIRMTYHDTVIYVTDDIDDAFDYMEENEIDGVVLEIDNKGYAYFPQF